MKNYFDAEMRLLNEAAIEFARSYPEQAGMLNLTEVRDRDPYIERLLEGMAYLTAHIRNRIDDDVPEISQTLLAQMWPQFIRPFPSATVIEFTTSIHQNEEPLHCKKGTAAFSGAVGEMADKERGKKAELVQCEYRTVTEVVLNPIRISRASLKEAVAGGVVIRIDFEIGAMATLNKLELSKLPLYLNGYPTLTLDLWYYLTQFLKEVRVRFPSSLGESNHYVGGQACITPAHMDLESSLLPKSGRSFTGTHLLHEYFCFREKFLFIDLQGLDVIEWPQGCKKFAIEMHVDARLPGDYRLDKETFRLHCAPAVNLFKAIAEPVKLDHQHALYRILADVDNPNAVGVYSVDKVESVGTGTGQRHTYHSIHELKHRTESPRHYHVTYSEQTKGGEDTYLSLGGISAYKEETLSCDIHAYNRHFPRRYLYEGSIRNNSKDNNELDSRVELSNITRPTSTYMPPESPNYQWGIVAHLALNYSSITEIDTLKRILSLYEWTGRKDNQRKIDGINDVSLEFYQEMHRGALMRGMEVRLTLHEGNYASISDIALFGQVLHRFFTLYANINMVVRTRIHCHPSAKELSWQPALGETSPM